MQFHWNRKKKKTDEIVNIQLIFFYTSQQFQLICHSNKTVTSDLNFVQTNETKRKEKQRKRN